MADATGGAKQPPLRVTFNHRLKLELHEARITSDGGPLAYRKLDDAPGLTTMGAPALAGGRRGRNIRHRLIVLLRKAVYRRLPATRTSTMPSGSPATPPCAPSSAVRAWTGRRPRPARMGRFETEWLATEANLAGLMVLSGAWIDRVHGRKPPDGIIADTNSSESPIYGEQEGLAYISPARSGGSRQNG